MRFEEALAFAIYSEVLGVNLKLFLPSSAFALILGLAGAAHASESRRTITVTDPHKVADAMAVNAAIDHLGDRVMECVDNRLAPPAKCFCLYPKEVAEVKLRYDRLIEENPEWRDQIIFWTIEGSPAGYNLVFSGLRKQLEETCGKP